jgi:hypothetical protein
VQSGQAQQHSAQSVKLSRDQLRVVSLSRDQVRESVSAATGSERPGSAETSVRQTQGQHHSTQAPHQKPRKPGTAAAAQTTQDSKDLLRGQSQQRSAQGPQAGHPQRGEQSRSFEDRPASSGRPQERRDFRDRLNQRHSMKRTRNQIEAAEVSPKSGTKIKKEFRSRSRKASPRETSESEAAAEACSKAG